MSCQAEDDIFEEPLQARTLVTCQAKTSEGSRLRGVPETLTS